MQHAGGMWSACLVGALIGVLSMVTFYFSDKPLGVSSAHARLAGMLARLFSKGHADGLKLYQDKTPKVEWEVMLVLGIVLGAFLAANGGEWTGTWVPAMWSERFGDGAGLRLAIAFVGGAVMKTMLTAITVGMVGIFGMHALGLVKLHAKKTQ